MKTSLLYGALHSLYNQFGNSVFKIFSFLIIHSHDRASSITRVHTTTWNYFTECLADRFFRSPEEVKEEIMTDINDLVQEFRTSSNGAVGASFIAMRRLLETLLGYFNFLNVCFDIISVFATAVDLADKNLQLPYSSIQYCASDRHQVPKFKIVLDGYRKMVDQTLSKSKDLGDMLRFLPGVVVQKKLSIKGMADLYGIEPNFLQRIKSIGLLRSSPQGPYHGYMLDDFLSRFLQERDRSQLYYCDSEIQHTSICRQILSLLDRSNVFEVQP